MKTPVSMVAPLPARALYPCLLALALLIAPMGEQLPRAVMAAFYAAVLWRAGAGWRGAGALSRSWRTALFVGAVVGGAFVRRAVAVPADAIISFLVLMAALKCLELKDRRDVVVLSLLAYVLVLDNFFLSQGLGYSLYLGACLWVSTLGWVAVHQASPAVGSRAGDRGPAAGTVGVAGMLFAHALPLAALAFVFFPRVGTGLFPPLRGPAGAEALSGFNGEDLDPGAIARLGRSEALAFRVRLRRPDGGEAVLAPSQLYWRAAVLGGCRGDGLRWGRLAAAPGGGRDRVGAMSAPAAAAVAADPGDVRQEILLQPREGDWVPALERPVRVDAPHWLDAEAGRVRAAGARPGQPQSFVLDSRPGERPESPPAATLSPAARRLYLALPEGVSAAVRQLGRRWSEIVPDPTRPREAVIVAHGLDYLRAGGFVYTTSPPAYGAAGGGGLAAFLLADRAGFCEHYAGAFATLLRVAGVPARVVVGYQGGVRNALTGYLVVRQSDAHAWVEAWIEGRGWQRVDPTAAAAPSRIAEGTTLGGEGWFSRLGRQTGWWNGPRFAWDAVDQAWNERVAGYDARGQREVQRGMFEALEAFGRQRWAPWLALPFAALFLAWGHRARRRRLGAPRRHRGGGADGGGSRLERRVRLEYFRWVERVRHRAARLGRPLPEVVTEGPMDFARRAGGALPEDAPTITRASTLYAALRYGAPAPDGTDRLEQLRTLTRTRLRSTAARP